MDPRRQKDESVSEVAENRRRRKTWPRERTPFFWFRTSSRVSYIPARFPDLSGFVKFSGRLNDALTPRMGALLSRGISVVLDFPANTRRQRAWFRAIIERAKADHELHFVDAPDGVCKAQLNERSQHLPRGSPWTTDAEFEAVTAYFQSPSEDEEFPVIHHQRS